MHTIRRGRIRNSKRYVVLFQAHLSDCKTCNHRIYNMSNTANELEPPSEVVRRRGSGGMFTQNEFVVKFTRVQRLGDQSSKTDSNYFQMKMICDEFIYGHPNLRDHRPRRSPGMGL